MSLKPYMTTQRYNAKSTEVLNMLTESKWVRKKPLFW